MLKFRLNLKELIFIIIYIINLLNIYMWKVIFILILLIFIYFYVNQDEYESFENKCIIVTQLKMTKNN